MDSILGAKKDNNLYYKKNGLIDEELHVVDGDRERKLCKGSSSEEKRQREALRDEGTEKKVHRIEAIRGMAGCYNPCLGAHHD